MTAFRTSIALIIGALTMVVAPAAAAADKPDDEHRYFATSSADSTRSAHQYGIPRAMPSHYEEAGVELRRQTGATRAMPADYAAAGVALDPLPVLAGDLRSPAASRPGFDWADAGVGAAAAALLMLGMIVSSVLMLRRRRETRMAPSVVQH